MAAAIITIELDRSRCIFINNVIYFSNYYLNQVITDTDTTIYPKEIKVTFNNKKFMNEDELDEGQKIPETINEKIQPLKIQANPDVTKYTMINLNFSETNGGLEKSAQDIFAELQSIFKDTDQIIQYLKYNGYWCTEPKQTPFGDRTKKSEEEEEEEGEEEEEEGDEAEGEEEDEEEEEEDQGGQNMLGRGGNKNTTRRNGTNNNQKSKSKKKK